MTTHTDVVGMRVRTARKARGFTQQQLADRAHLSKSLVTKIERGERPTTQPVIRALARALNLVPTDLNQPKPEGHGRRDERVHAAIPGLERALLSYDLPQPDEDKVQPRSFPQLQQDTFDTARFRMAAQYGHVADILPGLIEELIVSTRMLDGSTRERAFSALAVAYRCLDAVANKLGYLHLSYLAVERVRWAADNSGDPLMIATASYLRGQTCLDIGHYESGLQLLDQARHEIEPTNKTSIEGLSVFGTLHLRSAVLAACKQDAIQAWSHIEEARSIASHVGKDVTHYWTCFGPSNVDIHAVATAVELGDEVRAIHEASRVRISPGLPKERSSHHYIDLARAYLWHGDRDLSLDCLLTAERIAPQHTRYHPATRNIVRILIELARRSPDDLVGLAGRVGLRAGADVSR